MTKDEFYEMAKIVEIEIQSGKNYAQCIGMGYFTERFNDAWEKVKKLNIQPVIGCVAVDVNGNSIKIPKEVGMITHITYGNNMFASIYEQIGDVALLEFWQNDTPERVLINYIKPQHCL